MLFKEVRSILKKHQKNLVALGAKALSLFGSIARDEGSVSSDVDILVEFDSKKGLFGFIDLKSHLETLLHCEVDLVTKSALHPSLKKRILKEARNVF